MLGYKMLKGGSKEKRHSCPQGSERTRVAFGSRGVVGLCHGAAGLTRQIQLCAPRFSDDALSEAFISLGGWDVSALEKPTSERVEVSVLPRLEGRAGPRSSGTEPGATPAHVCFRAPMGEAGPRHCFQRSKQIFPGRWQVRQALSSGKRRWRRRLRHWAGLKPTRPGFKSQGTLGLSSAF